MDVTLGLCRLHLNQLRAACARSYPEEACGVLVGVPRGDRLHVTRVVAVKNSDPASRRRGYTINRQGIVELLRQCRDSDQRIIGFYHSHPDHPACPSGSDRGTAWPGLVYLICSVHAGYAADVTAWVLGPGGLTFDAVEIEQGPPCGPVFARQPGRDCLAGPPGGPYGATVLGRPG